jgi:hypothetical protein
VSALDLRVWEREMLEHVGSVLAESVMVTRAVMAMPTRVSPTGFVSGREFTDDETILLDRYVDLDEARQAFEAFPLCRWWEWGTP